MIIVITVYTWTASSGGVLFTSWILLPCAILTHFKKFSRVFFLGPVQMFETSSSLRVPQSIFRLVWLTKQQQIPTGWILSSVCLSFVCWDGKFLSVAVAENRAGMAGVEANVSRLFLSFFLWIGCVCVCLHVCAIKQRNKCETSSPALAIYLHRDSAPVFFFLF